MKKQDLMRQKTPIILIYVLLLADVSAIIFVQWSGVINDIIFPIAVFAGLTIIQSLMFHIVNNTRRVIGILTLITLIKCLGCFLLELILDFSNISFIRSEYYARSILMIGFLVLVIASAIAEILALVKLSKDDN